MALQWPSIWARVLIIKISVLLRVIKNDDTLSSRIFHALAASEVESLHLVRWCCLLESSLFTSDEISIYRLKKEIINKDWLSLSISSCVPTLPVLHPRVLLLILKGACPRSRTLLSTRMPPAPHVLLQCWGFSAYMLFQTIYVQYLAALIHLKVSHLVCSLPHRPHERPNYSRELMQ